jgi:hypothetical protein
MVGFGKKTGLVIGPEASMVPACHYLVWSRLRASKDIRRYGLGLARLALGVGRITLGVLIVMIAERLASTTPHLDLDLWWVPAPVKRDRIARPWIRLYAQVRSVL